MFDLRLENGNSDCAAREVSDNQARDQELSGTKCPAVGRADSNPCCDRERQPRREHQQRPKLRRLAQMLRDKPRMNAGSRGKPERNHVRGDAACDRAARIQLRFA